MLVVDTNVFLYAAGSQHPLQSAARALIDAAGAGRVMLTTTALVVQEVVHVRSVRRSRADAVSVAQAVAELCDPLLPVLAEDVELALALFAEYDRLDAFDALLAATALRSGAGGLVSADRAFADVRGLRHHDLATLDLNSVSR